MNSEKIKKAVEAALKNLSSLEESDFKSLLENHAEGDVAADLLRSGFFDVAEIEAECLASIENYEHQFDLMDFDIQPAFLSTSWTSIEFDQVSLASISSAHILNHQFSITEDEFAWAA